VGQLLKEYSDQKLHVLVVWEPILPADWGSPSASTLGRITDRRARQFWDPQHLVAQELSRMVSAKPGEPKPECCVNKGFFWDDAILYAPRAQWKDAPASVFWNGPVVRVLPGLGKALSSIK
jgi:hypothetical protein